MLKIIRKLLVKHHWKYERQQFLQQPTLKKNLKVEPTGLNLQQKR